MKKILPMFLLSFLTFSFTAVQAQTANDIIDNFFEVTGGEKWTEVTSMRMTGMSSNQGMDFPITVVGMRPNMQMVKVDISEKSFVDCFDGEVAWSINPFMGGTEPTKKNEEETAEAAENNFEPDLLNWEEKGHTVTREDDEKLDDGTECFVLKLVKESGDEEYYLFDKDSGVLILQRSFMKSGPMKGQAIETYMSDYDEVDGIYIAHSMEQKLNGQTVMQMTAEEIELDPEDVSKETFAFPAKD